MGCRKPLKMLHQPCPQYTDSPIPSWRKFVTCALCLVPLFVTKFTYSPTNYAWSTSHVLTLSFDQGDIANYFPQSQLLDMFAGHVKALMYRMCNPKHPEAHSINSHRRNHQSGTQIKYPMSVCFTENIINSRALFFINDLSDLTNLFFTKV